MAQDMGRGIMAPENNDLIGTGASEMRTQAVTTVAAIDAVDGKIDGMESSILSTVADHYVAGDQIRRIITSTNVQEPTQPGDLLVITEPRRYFTDFRFDQPGTAPDGWTLQFESEPDSWTIESSPDTPSGRVLRNNNPDHLRMALGWDEIPDDTIVEMLIKTRSMDRLSDTARPTIDGSMPLSGVWSYINLSRQRTNMVIARDGDTTETFGEEIPHLTVGAWTYMRLRREQDRAYAKTWVEGTPEPSEWDTDNGLISPLPHGWIGLQSSRHGAEVAFVSAALDGGEAPKNLW